MNFVAVAIVFAIALATRPTKESTFDWFKRKTWSFKHGLFSFVVRTVAR